jgi:WD40 repeat protein
VFLVAALLCALLTCCGCTLLFIVGDPLEHIQDAQSLASIEVPLDTEPFHYHVAGRDELVFLRESNLEVYRIDPHLTRLRIAPLAPEIDTKFFRHISAFPNSPLVIVYGSDSLLYIVSTQTGQVERRITLTSQPENAIISPDERWLALGPPVLTLIDLQTGERIELPGPRGEPPSHYGTTFLTPRSLFVTCRNTSDSLLWDLRTRQVLWSGPEPNQQKSPIAAVGNESWMVTGSHHTCQVWATETGRVIRSHTGNRPAWAVTIHPKTGDYLAGYSMLNYSLPSRLDGAVRIWGADGERLTSFAAHKDTERPGVNWMAVSSSGEYLVTAGRKTVKVWDYSALTRP